MGGGQVPWLGEKPLPCKARRMRPVEFVKINHYEADDAEDRLTGEMRVYTEAIVAGLA